MLGNLNQFSTIVNERLAQKEKRPREAQSAGLSWLLTCLHQSGGTSCTMWDTQLPTNVLSRRGLPVNQLRTIALSVQAKTFSVVYPVLVEWVARTVWHHTTRGREWSISLGGNLRLGDDQWHVHVTTSVLSTNVHNTWICIFGRITEAI